MNSYDTFNQDVVLVGYTIRSSRLVENGRGDNILNTNADFSYLPLYPGVSSEIQLKKSKISADEYQNVELLGRSKNIDGYIEITNPSPDPYFSYDTISGNYTFGRVYEDYQDFYDKTFKMFENPPLNTNINPSWTDGEGSSIKLNPS